MTGSLQIKKNFYYAVLNFKDQNGKRKTKWISTGLPVKDNKRKAQLRLNELIAEYTDNTYVEPTKILFCDFMAEWVETNKINVQAITYANYKYLLNAHVYPYFKKLGVTLHKVTPLQIQQYYNSKINSGLSPNTVIKHHALIRSSLAYAMKLRLIKENVADLVEKPKKQKYIGQYYNVSEINKLLSLIKGTSIEMPVMLAAYFGLRRSEIIGVKWNSINFDSRTITINHKVVPTTIDGKCKLNAIDDLKTSSSYRSFPLDDFFYNYFIKEKEKQQQNRELFGNSYDEQYLDYVCVNEMGTLLQPDFVTRRFGVFIKENGLKKIRFHDLRHSCATLLLSLGCGMKDIQAYLGHSNINTTLNIYCHLDPESKKNLTAGLSMALALV